MKAIKFPFEKGYFVPDFAEDEVASAILQELFTFSGERVMRPEIGSGVEALIFEDENIVESELRRLVVEAVIKNKLDAVIEDVKVVKVGDVNYGFITYSKEGTKKSVQFKL